MFLAIAYTLSLLHGLWITRLLVKAGYGLGLIFALGVLNSLLVSMITILTYIGLK